MTPPGKGLGFTHLEVQEQGGCSNFGGSTEGYGQPPHDVGCMVLGLCLISSGEADFTAKSG